MRKDRIKAKGIDGFTFVELMVVLAILSIMVTVVLPYANRTGRHAQLQQESANLETALILLIEQAKRSQRPTRLVVDTIEQSYQLQQASNRPDEDFEPLPGNLGQVRFISRSCSFDELDGFQSDGKKTVLLFDPSRPWPHGSLTLIDELETVRLEFRGQIIEWHNEQYDE